MANCRRDVIDLRIAASLAKKTKPEMVESLAALLADAPEAYFEVVEHSQNTQKRFAALTRLLQAVSIILMVACSCSLGAAEAQP
jgi:hypothetical protein